MIRISLIHSCPHTKGHSAGCYLPRSKISKDTIVTTMKTTISPLFHPQMAQNPSLPIHCQPIHLLWVLLCFFFPQCLFQY